eukprot:gnl/MRDRNA2_/MRDRNA2_108316_c0_seq1.p1 gnl/MRDRNA2_/MRDRNA2_108316_c0~~gnl/MRDRNA2_/MRDRNA2_108316_c0_seq1.p1  ORF type:complete len:393 (+),score=89.94 gnl/MRDRNA2_/MRDRNA2_108316_c0_seq1:116-1294(+)
MVAGVLPIEVSANNVGISTVENEIGDNGVFNPALRRALKAALVDLLTTFQDDIVQEHLHEEQQKQPVEQFEPKAKATTGRRIHLRTSHPSAPQRPPEQDANATMTVDLAKPLSVNPPASSNIPSVATSQPFSQAISTDALPKSLQQSAARIAAPAAEKGKGVGIVPPKMFVPIPAISGVTRAEGSESLSGKASEPPPQRYPITSARCVPVGYAAGLAVANLAFDDQSSMDVAGSSGHHEPVLQLGGDGHLSAAQVGEINDFILETNPLEKYALMSDIGGRFRLNRAHLEAHFHVGQSPADGEMVVFAHSQGAGTELSRLIFQQRQASRKREDIKKQAIAIQEENIRNCMTGKSRKTFQIRHQDSEAWLKIKKRPRETPHLGELAPQTNKEKR